jgi:serine protease Do
MTRILHARGMILLAYFTLALLMSAGAGAAAIRELPDFTELVEQSSPSVVNISTSTKVSRESMRRQHRELPPGSPFDDFLRRFFGDEFGGGGDEEFSERSLGSGFIISSDGYVMTNNHVIRDADEVVVRLSDRREFVAEVVGTDKRSDVALLKIDATGLPVAKIGKSEDLKVGSWVLAIGSPFGFEHSVTAGIVSAMGRSLPNENYVPFIQTDVAINPGNSGGPLYNLKGEVVGVNSQIYSRTGGFMGLSFAIPIDMAMHVVEQLQTQGHVSRGWLGILIQDVTRELAESFGMSKPIGALVARVLPDSPAEAAGIQVGDVIVTYRGHEVGSSSALPPMVGATRVGSEAEVKVMREGKPMTLKITISELPEDDEVRVSRRDDPNVAIERLNLVVMDPTSEQLEELDGKSGVLVESVQTGPASRAGIRRGDLLMRFDNVEVRDAAHLNELVKELPDGKSVPVLVQRRGSPIFLALRVE